MSKHHVREGVAPPLPASPRQLQLLRSQRAVDSLIASVEELNLIGRQRVPEDWAIRLDDTASLLAPEVPAELCSELRPRIGVSRLLDALFAASEQLQLKRLGDRAVDYADEDEVQPQDA